MALVRKCVGMNIIPGRFPNRPYICQRSVRIGNEHKVRPYDYTHHPSLHYFFSFPGRKSGICRELKGIFAIFREEEKKIISEKIKEFYYDSEVDITRIVLNNGLQVLVKNMAGVSLVSMSMWLNIGSNNEDDRVAGIAHFIEHMLFKGTEKYKVGEIARDIEKLGGYLNGFTSYDATAYQITVPSKNFPPGLDILLEALENSSFDPIEIEKEGQVILEECKMRDDTPHVFAWENLMKLAFKKHRYGRSIIGDENVIKEMTREELLDFFKKFYVPENMTLIIAGNVDIKVILKKLENFSMISPDEPLHDLSPQEPVQKEFRFSHITGDIERTYLDIGFRIPDQLHYDAFVLEILSSIIGEGRSSRLYQEVKEKKELVTQISTGDVNGREPGLFMISAVTDGDKVSKAIKSIWIELEKIKNETVSKEEFEKTKNSIEHDYLFDLETVDGQVDKIGHFANLGDYTMAVKYLDILKRIPPEDIKRVAQRYFKPENCSISVYSPKSDGEAKLDLGVKELENTIKNVIGKKDGKLEKELGILLKKDRLAPVKMKLKNGVTLVAERDKGLPVATFYAGFKGGVRFEPPDKNGLCRFMARLLIKGTGSSSAGEIATRIETLGSYLVPRTGKDSFGLSMSILKKYKDRGMDLFFEVLTDPIFSEEEIEKERKFILAGIKEKKDDPLRTSIELCDSLIYEKHPYGMPTTGKKETVKNITRSDIAGFYKNYVHGENMYMAVVGDIEPDNIADKIEKLFKMEDSHGVKDFPVPEKEKASKKKKTKIVERDIKQSSICTGFLGCSILSPDYFGFAVLNSVLNGMGSRLFIELRDIKGLAYVVFSYLNPGIENGSFKTYIATSPELEEAALEGMLLELEKIKAEGVTKEEVAKAKSVIKGRFEINLQERSFRSGRYSTYENLGIGYDRLLKYPELLEKVTKEEVNRIAEEYFDLDNYSLAIIRPGS